MNTPILISAKGLEVTKVSSMVSDGAAVMLGCKNGVGKKLEKDNPHIITVHCICHNLALACNTYKGLNKKETDMLIASTDESGAADICAILQMNSEV